MPRALGCGSASILADDGDHLQPCTTSFVQPFTLSYPGRTSEEETLLFTRSFAHAISGARHDMNRRKRRGPKSDSPSGTSGRISWKSCAITGIGGEEGSFTYRFINPDDFQEYGTHSQAWCNRGDADIGARVPLSRNFRNILHTNSCRPHRVGSV